MKCFFLYHLVNTEWAVQCDTWKAFKAHSGWSLVVCLVNSYRCNDEFDPVIRFKCKHAKLFSPFWCACVRAVVNVLTCWFPLWCLQVLSAHGEPKSPLDLKPRLNYTVQVRCSYPDDPPLWSDWSERHHIYLDSKNHFMGCGLTVKYKIIQRF